MAMKFLTPIDLGKLEIQNAVAQVLGADPGTPVPGQFWYRSDLGTWNFENAAGIIRLGRLDQITAPTAAVAMNAQKITGLADPGAAQDAATQNYVLTRSLSQLAAPTADLAIGTHKLTGVSDPTVATDAATKNYVDNAVNGLNWKSPVRAASTANVVIASALINGAVMDGVTLATGDRVLLKNQTAGAENGIYIVAAAGAASRSTDANLTAEVLQMAVGVEEGTAAADTFWVMTTNGPITLATTALVFASWGAGAAYTAGAGLALSTNVFSIENAGVLTTAHGGTGGATVAAAKTALGFMGRFAVDVGDGSTTSIVVTHSLGTLDVIVQVFDKTTPFAEVMVETRRTSTTTITLVFAVAPTAAQYRVVVIG